MGSDVALNMIYSFYPQCTQILPNHICFSKYTQLSSNKFQNNVNSQLLLEIYSITRKRVRQAQLLMYQDIITITKKLAKTLSIFPLDNRA